MYEAHFRLQARPFDLTPNPRFLYLGRKHSLALTLLEYGLVSEATVAVITGEVGSGKTTLLRHLLTKAPRGAAICMISQTPPRLADLIGWVLADLGEKQVSDDPAAQQRQLLQLLEARSKAGGRVVLIIDEAQNLEVATLEGIRMLTNVNVEGRVALQLILSGQPELLQKLRRDDLRQLAQRVSVDFHLQGLEEEETINYIGHRLTVAGGADAIFPNETRRLVHAAAGGIPRLINMLCDMGLVYAFAEGQSSVTPELMQAVISDRRAGGVAPLAPAPAPKPALAPHIRLATSEEG